MLFADSAGGECAHGKEFSIFAPEACLLGTHGGFNRPKNLFYACELLIYIMYFY
jgi:hypothetical protein